MEQHLDKRTSALYNASCIDVLKELKDGEVDLIVTDPPYRVTSSGTSGTLVGMMQKSSARTGKLFKHNDIKIEEYARELYRVLKEGGQCYIMTNQINLQNMLNVLTDLRTKEEKKSRKKKYGFKFIKSLIWMKDNKIVSRYYMNQYEYILYFRKGSVLKVNDCGVGDILQVPNKKTKDEEGKNIHDTEKPVDLMKILVSQSSQEGELVLDPFMGLGATILASESLNRRYIGVELDEEYYEKSVSRLETQKEKRSLKNKE